MRAVVYTNYGSASELKLKNIEKPQPKADEVCIKVFAAEVTKADCELRSFKFPVKWFWVPLRLGLGLFKPKRQVLGGYFAGEIESMGDKVTRFKVGDQVFGSTQLKMGAYGEYICLPSDYTIVKKPHNIDFIQSAAVPLGGLNALHFMRKAKIKTGDTVLINGAGGSIGTFAVQIAKSMGADVTAVDSCIKEAMLRNIGADHFIDYNDKDFTKDKERYDVILDMVAQSSYTSCIGVLKPCGRYLLGNPRISDMFRSVFSSWFGDKLVIFAFAGEREQELVELKDMIEAGTIMPALDNIYGMEQIVEAHQRVESEQRLGIVVLSLDKQQAGIN
ncbi:NAD(P)-dependent alcohol dehydrogenase [Alginatibacterium sediminis]|uniref:NAD(P)-dependent alcohol dehydrogenase n=1 Tax=Alginatibacterium sediminis TaxID=2164068 RepID=A0A420EHJ6_9ALTE|nr:NAD(P)-dependent alcohol dehydrogenase [Alginatibacterium sediminis]RKF20124.1 NAD(P)-dependent alcohol dehydrogenase [Alginatibacterium sediminis]